MLKSMFVYERRMELAQLLHEQFRNIAWTL